MFEKRNLDKKKLYLVNRIIRKVTVNKHIGVIKSKNDMLSAIISAEDMETLEVIERNMNSLTIWQDYDMYQVGKIDDMNIFNP